MIEDIAIMKNEIIHLRIDINKLLSVIVESENALVKRTAISETKIAQIEEKFIGHLANAFNVKLAMASSLIGLISCIVVALIEFWNRK